MFIASESAQAATRRLVRDWRDPRKPRCHTGVDPRTDDRTQEASMAVHFDETTQKILDGKNFAVVTTLGPDGEPQSSVVWVKREGDTVLFSSLAKRRKVANIAADPRVSVAIFDLQNPYDSVEIRGRAELIDDESKSLGKELSHKYLDEDPPSEPDNLRRVIVRIVPDKVNRFTA
jgi:PPOX class probable F420-dependent enzyme